MPSAWQPPQSSQALYTAPIEGTNNTPVIRSGVRGFVTAPSRGLATPSKAELAVRARSACPLSATATCPARKSSSSVRCWLARRSPRVRALRACWTTNLTNNKCRPWRPTVVQRPPKAAPMTIERYCTKRRRWISPSGWWHQYSTSSTVLAPRSDGNYRPVCAAQQAVARAVYCQRRVPRPHPSQEAARQAENGTIQAINRAWTVAPRGRY